MPHTHPSAVLLLSWSLALIACKSKSADHHQGHRDLNASFKDPDMDVAHYQKLFEADDRPVFVYRKEIIDALNLRPSMGVADIGAGTGFFLEHIAGKVGPEGTVYAVEISKRFLDHIRDLAKAKGLPQIRAVEASDSAVNLPDASIDLALICDTYHHFEHPKEVMQSIHRALRPGGRVAVIEFIKNEETKDEWVLEHVRAGEDVFTQEIESVGFAKVEAPTLPFLSKTYLVMFEKR